MANRFRTNRVRGVKRRTFWARSPSDAALTTLSASSAVLDSTLVPGLSETIVRTRGYIAVKSDQVAASENFTGAVGFLVASDQAVAAGVASLPTPYTDQDSDLYFVHQYFTGGLRFSDVTGMGDRPWSIFEFDSKAMRKLDVGQTLCIVIENGSAVGMQYFITYSVLIKLP